MPILAEMLVFSGNANPSFELDAAEAATLAALIGQATAAGGARTDQAEAAVLGYRGFRVSGDILGAQIDIVTVVPGAVIIADAEGLLAFPDGTGCEQALLLAARNHGFGDLLDELATEPNA